MAKNNAAALVDADHLAAVAERLLAAVEELAVAQSRLADGSGGDALGAVWQAEESLTEARHAAALAIHEYRKRRVRAR